MPHSSPNSEPAQSSGQGTLEVKPEEALAHALELATTSEAAPTDMLKSTTARTMTRRGVMWLGQTCNLRCHFCYFIERIKAKSHPEHAFMSLDKAKKISDTLVEVYGNNAIDIQGGEPTIWSECLDFVRYCRDIGLVPTLITNALVLDKRENCEKYLEAGLRDLLVSVHGLGETHDRVVALPGAHRRQMIALKNCQEVGIPFRFNCVLSKSVAPQLPAIARLAVATGARGVNFLAFNPFEDQAKGERRSAENVPRYSEVVVHLSKALDILEEAGIEANVRYYPLCVVDERHRKSMYNFQQLTYDHHEWDYASWTWTGMQPQRMREGDVSTPRALGGAGALHILRDPVNLLMKVPILKEALPKIHGAMMGKIGKLRGKDSLYAENARVRARLHCSYAYDDRCSECSAKGICDGFHGDYAAIFSTDEAQPIVADTPIRDPRHYISRQVKNVEPEDEGCAL